jgi:hypothetical protein
MPKETDSMLSSKLLSIIAGLLLTTAAYAQTTPVPSRPNAPVSSQSSGSSGLPAFGTLLSGFNETPSIFTKATGTFAGTIDSATQELAFTLSYSGLSAPVTMAHIHFGKDNVAGAIIAFLCGGDNKPACPQEGTVTGTITANDIIAVDAQGVPADSFDALVAAIVSDSAYANVHTVAHPAGEIRGQIEF